MVKRSFSLIVAVILIGCLAFSALAVDVTSYDFSDSGIQVFAAPQRAAALAVAADTASATAGDYGYNFYPATILCQYQPRTNNTAAIWIPSGVYDGHYYFVFTFDSSVSAATSVYVNGQSTAYPCTKSVDGNSAIFDITFDNTSAPSGISFFVSFPNLASAVSFVSYDSTCIIPVDGISSGYTYSSGANTNAYTVGDTISASFGNQPAGEYLINIYQFAQGCDASYSLAYNGRKLATNEQGGTVTAVVSHGGGDLTLDGRFTATRTTNREISGATTAPNTGLVRLDMMGPGTWIFEIYDIVAVPLSNAGLEQYGIFGPVVGFFRDQYSSLKSFLSGQFQSIKDIFKGDSTGEFEQATSEANSALEQQTQIEDQLIGDFETNAGNVDPSTVTVPNDVLSGFAVLSDIFMLVFNGFGNYQALIYVPLCIGIALVCIGRGFNAADRVLRSQTYHKRQAAKNGGAGK